MSILMYNAELREEIRQVLESLDYVSSYTATPIERLYAIAEDHGYKCYERGFVLGSSDKENKLIVASRFLNSDNGKKMIAKLADLRACENTHGCINCETMAEIHKLVNKEN